MGCLSDGSWQLVGLAVNQPTTCTAVGFPDCNISILAD